MLMTTTYHFRIEKVKFDKNVNIPIPGAVNFTVPREDLLEIHDTDCMDAIKKFGDRIKKLYID